MVQAYHMDHVAICVVFYFMVIMSVQFGLQSFYQQGRRQGKAVRGTSLTAAITLLQKAIAIQRVMIEC